VHCSRRRDTVAIKLVVASVPAQSLVSVEADDFVLSELQINAADSLDITALIAIIFLSILDDLDTKQ
jgi:hypothetical protein